MAKIFTDRYNDYLALKDWAHDNKFTCPNGMLIDLSNSIYYRQEDDFGDDEYTSVMSTGETEDYFLIKYCPLEFVQMDVRGSYDDEEYIQDILNGKSAYDIFVRPDSGKNKVIMTYRGCKYNKLWNIINYRNIWRKQKFSIDVFL